MTAIARGRAAVSRTDALRRVEDEVDRFVAGNPVPGLAYGIVADGELVHSRGRGSRVVGEEAVPDADTVFRIASMTKSFTAAALLLLRDEGRLSLDDPVAAHVPELAGLRGPTSDSPPITLRHLLTMSAGLPTDDPWGDRQQGLDLDAFAALLRGGLTFAWAPGTRFEYSNLGYGILGRVLSNVAGREHREVVRERLLDPLGMDSTGYLEEDVPVERLARGYVRRDEAWLAEPIEPYGALASMGGVFSSVRDLGRWVAGFTDAFPPRDGPEGGHPLSRATRREMQQVQRSVPPELSAPSADAPAALLAGGYGFGLFVADDLRWGRVVGHSGGYPGYGSNMRWHPSSGLGVVVLINGRYAPATLAARDLLRVVLEAEAAPIRRVRPSDPALAARERVEALLERWDDAAAAELCAMNIELDEPLSRRRAAIERLREVHGRLRPDGAAEVESASPLHLAWWMAGDRGRVRVELLLTPHPSPQVQTLTVTSVPEPPDHLARLGATVAGLLAEACPSLPPDLALAAAVDRAAVERSVRAAAARFGPVTAGRPSAGDGAKEATWRLHGDRGDVDLKIELDAADGSIVKLELVPRTVRAPDYAD